MSAKKKADRSHWTECSQCELYVPTKSLSQHNQLCTLKVEGSNVESSGKLQTGFIDNGILHGKITRTAPIKSKLS